MKKSLIKYFALSNTEFNGIFVLILLIFSVYFTAECYLFFTTSETISIEKWKDSTIANVESRPKIQRSSSHKNTIKSVQFYDFDPNTIELSTWMDFGLSEKQAQSILNYRAKGGKFYKKEDLKKMFVISASLYEKLAPHILIVKPQYTAQNHLVTTEEKPAFVPKIIELNDADTAQLQRLKGIGSVFAARIVKYRNRLGGFHHASQLREVYGMSDSLFQKIAPFLRIDPSKIQKVNINLASFNDLKKFPYLSYKQIHTLLEYRKQHGAFLTEKDLEKVVILPAETIRKLAPYLQYDELRDH